LRLERGQRNRRQREENRRDQRETGRGGGDAQKTNGYPLKAAKPWCEEMRHCGSLITSPMVTLGFLFKPFLHVWLINFIQYEN